LKEYGKKKGRPKPKWRHIKKNGAIVREKESVTVRTKCKSNPLRRLHYSKILWWGEMAPLPKKSPDLGNSYPVPRALMYVASLQTFGLASSS
jgi:hypothetical protein